jgi:hypothetical protein
MGTVARDPAPEMQELEVWLARMLVWCRGLDRGRD